MTPNISRIAGQSPTFHQVYATGLRTVRGLEALTLSLPPTPGGAVPIHVKNRGLASLGPEQAQRGYDTLYLYGGYSFFDNMNDFFSGAGYTMIDRTSIAPKSITKRSGALPTRISSIMRSKSSTCAAGTVAGSLPTS